MSKRGTWPAHHAFIDESRRGPRYFLTAVLVVSRDVQAVTKATREVLPSGQRRAHFSDESDKKRRQILDGFSQLPVGVTVAVAQYRGGDDQVARNACLVALLSAFTQLNVGVAILDTRGVERDRVDRQVIAMTIKEGRGPEGLRYSHRGSRDEMLLGLPDAFGWCYGVGGVWKKQVQPLIVMTLDA